MRHFEQSLGALAPLAIDSREKLELLAIVDDYVFGFAFRTAELAASFDKATNEEIVADLLPHFEAQVRSGDYPHIEALFGDSDVRTIWELIVETMTADGRFEQGLQRLLDGIEGKLTG
jgi:hypothetical protein